jgi:5-methyltetrahydrofolate--homocysteine methyltransferase
MQRQNFHVPLLIGGATTSKIHTAVKIEPQYKNDIVVYVADASRAVGVASALLSKEQKPDYVANIRAEYEQVRVKRAANQTERKLISITAARENKFKADWANYTPPKPTTLTSLVFNDYPLAELVERIDWTPFFRSWEMAGRFPDILTDEIVGEECTKLYADAQAMLKTLVDEKWVQAKALVGFFPANAQGDDVVLYTDESRSEQLTVLHNLRMQMERNGQQPNFCLGDFVAPVESGKADWMGVFVVSTGFGIEPHLKAFREKHDDYSAIMLEALCDRLAEALAERMHERVRKEFWGYAADETLDNNAMIAEKYQGIRPAPGYPACPDHTEKATLWTLLDVEANTGMELTSSFAMYPASSVSGWYFSHPDSRYFGIGRIARDQVEDYAKRKGMTVAEAERWLAPVLGYEA